MPLRILGITQNNGGDIFVSNTRAIDVGGAISTGNGNIGLRNNNGDITLAAAISATGPDNTVALEALNGNISQIVPATITASRLSASALTGNVELFDPSNSVSIVAGKAGGTGGFEFDNASSFSVGDVPAIGTLFQSGPFIPEVAGIITNNAPITLTAHNGNIIIGQSVNAGSSGTVNLIAFQGDITTPGSGHVSGNTLNMEALGIGTQATPFQASVARLSAINAGGSDIAISNAELPLNIIGLTQNNGGNIFVSNTRSITVTGAIKTSNGDIGLRNNNGDITLAAPISATGANNIVALEALNGNISQIIPSPITASRLSASALTGNAELADLSNAVSIVAGRAGGTGGFIFNNSKSFSVGTVPLVGPGYAGGFFIPSLSGITTTQGPITIKANSGDINLNGNINAGANNINIAAPGGSILQGPSNPTVTTTGTFTASAGNNIGSNAASGFIQTHVGTLIVPKANDVFINNIGTDNLTLPQILGSGVVNVGTAGPLTIPPGNGTTNFTGFSITLIAGGIFNIGNGNVFSANNGAGTINLYAGFNPVPGSSPVSNGSNSALIQGGVFNGGSINLFANSFDDFLGSATYSTPPHYSPAPPVSPITAPISVIVASARYVDGLNRSISSLLIIDDGVTNAIEEISCSN